MSYVDFTYYSISYLGTLISATDFPRLALRASAVIDQLTFNRAAIDFAANLNVTAIKNATCAVAEETQNFEQSGNADGIQSETIGQNSVTYTQYGSRSLTATEKYQVAAFLYLASTGLMFKGFAVGEYSSDLNANP